MEGADTWVWEGARQLLKHRRFAHIMYEENADKMASPGIEPGTAERLLRENGYEVTTFGDETAAGLTEFHAYPRGPNS